MFPAGTVFLWRNFPHVRDPRSELKDRWFVCLGRTGLYTLPVIYLSTTTGEISHYQSGGDRVTHDFIIIRSAESCFPADSVLDLTINFYEDVTEQQLKAHTSDLQQVGNLSELVMRRIYKAILRCPRISRKVKADIHSSFNMAGITGLKRP